MRVDLASRALGPAADGGTWARLRSLADAIPQVGTVRALAAALRAEPLAELPPSSYLAFEQTGDRAAFEARYFQRRRRLAALALAALLDPGEDISALTATIEAICDEQQWALPAHVGGQEGILPELVVDLFAAETASALAEITALLKDRLPTAVRHRVRDVVLTRVVSSYETHTFWWEDSPNNWASVCAGSVALAALQVCEPERVRAMAPRLRASLRRSLDGYGDDGVCVEGFGYWTYGFGYFLVATEALDAALGPDPVPEPARAAEAARWPARAFLSGHVVVPFADARPTGALVEGLLAMTARRYGGVATPDPSVVAPDVIDDCGRWSLALHGLCRLPAPGEQVWAQDAAPPLWFPDAQWLVVPQGPRSPIGFAARGGHNDEPHNHNDLGSFAIAAAGELLIGDAGRGVYDREYFGPARYDNPAAGSQGHPVPLVGGMPQTSGGAARAEVLEVALDGGRERLVLDLTSAYAHSGLVRLVRTIERDGATVTVSDAVETSEPVRVTQRFTCLAEPALVTPGEVRIAGDRATAVVRYDPRLEVATGAFPPGRGSFEIPVWFVDLTTTADVLGELELVAVIELT